MKTKIYKFKDDELEGSINIVVSKIISFGFNITEINENTGIPERAVIWINTSNMNFNRNLPYDEAVSIEEKIMEEIYLNR